MENKKYLSLFMEAMKTGDIPVIMGSLTTKERREFKEQLRALVPVIQAEIASLEAKIAAKE